MLLSVQWRPCSVDPTGNAQRSGQLAGHPINTTIYAAAGTFGRAFTLAGSEQQEWSDNQQN
ncbi:hypothetical protein GCM10011504_53060 [Siccirubricoccus deserti]|uniref:Uncharacterized protein n=1 Tax=Siccirubricoccus deserti TaxID=2013562 RepID=A0A9X0R3I8_9PROT|nr:hypothetical protein [Siccirubricoccus deserti]MBC4018814.1 hypothetical protein [Siccirubricoccus deserti]GGC68492.1 hypothetical protein GCM10011504_53060 [Siccirubricoccus deserti]